MVSLANMYKLYPYLKYFNINNIVESIQEIRSNSLHIFYIVHKWCGNVNSTYSLWIQIFIGIHVCMHSHHNNRSEIIAPLSRHPRVRSWINHPPFDGVHPCTSSYPPRRYKGDATQNAHINEQTNARTHTQTLQPYLPSSSSSSTSIWITNSVFSTRSLAPLPLPVLSPEMSGASACQMLVDPPDIGTAGIRLILGYVI